jgi:hypothetical protein
MAVSDIRNLVLGHLISVHILQQMSQFLQKVLGGETGKLRIAVL